MQRNRLFRGANSALEADDEVFPLNYAARRFAWQLLREGKLQQSRKKGAAYECLAAAFLQKKGYKILKRNYYSPKGEIDLIAQDGDYLVFVEVKYRADSRYGHPLEMVDGKKQRRIQGAARCYLRENGLGDETDCRFDVVGMLKEEMIHIENAF